MDEHIEKLQLLNAKRGLPHTHSIAIEAADIIIINSVQVEWENIDPSG